MKWNVRLFPSRTNFFLLWTKIPDAVAKLRDLGILVSDLSHQSSPGFIRVSIGTREENDIFIAGYKKIRKAYDERCLSGMVQQGRGAIEPHQR